jgi:hypothetical protein
MSTNYNILEDKELFEYLGRALYECQRLELSLAYVIRDTHLLRGDIQGKDLLECLQKFQEVLHSRLKCPLGNLFKELRRLGVLGDEDERIIGNALDKRNELVHRFFYEHWVAMIAPSGRDVMLSDLKQSIEIITTAYKIGKKIQNRLDDRMKQDTDKA